MPTVLDLFAGAGGFSLGFRQAGFDVRRAVENHNPKAETYRANFPDVELWERDMQETVVRDAYDVVIGGPPCEPFTPANADRAPTVMDRLYKDRIGQLVLQFIRIVGDVRPKTFVMENVIQVAEGPLRAELEKHLRERGYARLHFNELRAEDAGTPSHRLRLFLSNQQIDLPKGPKAPTVREALAGLPPPGNSPANHLAHPLTPDKVERIRSVKPGGALYGYRAATGKSHANWQRLKAEELAPTVLGNSRFIHPTEDRLLTPREHARLMGFPDSFVLKGGRDQQYDAVGEAVPPPLARAIAESLKTAKS